MQRFANKKLVEWRHLEKFQQTYTEFPSGMICLQEQPDFVVKTVDGMLGIEVREWSYDVELSGGSPTRRHESLSFRTVLRSQELYDSLGLIPVNVWLNFHRPLTEIQLEDLASEITNVVTSHIPNSGCTVSVTYPEPDWQMLPSQVSAIFIERPAGEQDAIWVPIGGGALPVVAPYDIEDVLIKKEPLLQKYRESADKIWLLIATTGFNTSAFCKIDSNLERHTFKTDFDQVFFHHEFSRKILSLQVVAKST